MPPAPLITIAEARDCVLSAVVPLGQERVSIERALDRVLAADLRAAGDVPPFPCSAMDGYALHDGPAGRELTVVGESRAGDPFAGNLAPSEAIRISTGAAVPVDATAVIRQEDVQADGEGARRVTALVATPPGNNIRFAGEDMHAGDLILRQGTLIGVAELGAAIAAGAAELPVARRPSVAVLSTGDELRAAGEPLEPGQIHNSNGPVLAALASRAGALAEAARRLPDDRALTEAELGRALDQVNVVIVSGGVSVGPHDHVKPALAALGVQERFWGVALQPGKPTWFGTLGERLVFGLPGNPVSAVVTFSLFARPALAALQGRRPSPPFATEARLASDVSRNGGREQAIRVRLEQRGGELFAIPNGDQGSHIVSSLVGADALAVIPRGEGVLGAGAIVALESLAS